MAQGLGCSLNAMDAAIQLRHSFSAPPRTLTMPTKILQWRCAVSQTEAPVKDPPLRTASRQIVRLALPSKGRMAEDALDLLKSCQLTIRKPNPRQYIADVVEMDGLEVWFQRASDVVRKLRSGDVDLGIVGYDMFREFGEDDPDLIIVHDALGFGGCHLAIAVPTYGIFENVHSLSDLLAMPQWTAAHPLRIVTGYTHLGHQFVANHSMPHVSLSTADGALEAAPAMGTSDAILDLVSSGTTLRENNLKELAGARVLESQGVLVASRKALLTRKGALEATHEMLERLEAHLRAKNQFSVTANIRGQSAEEVAQRICDETSFPGLQAGGSGVLVQPITYIFDEEPPRWRQLLEELQIDADALEL